MKPPEQQACLFTTAEYDIVAIVEVGKPPVFLIQRPGEDVFWQPCPTDWLVTGLDSVDCTLQDLSLRLVLPVSLINGHMLRVNGETHVGRLIDPAFITTADTSRHTRILVRCFRQDDWLLAITCTVEGNNPRCHMTWRAIVSFDGDIMGQYPIPKSGIVRGSHIHTRVASFGVITAALTTLPAGYVPTHPLVTLATTPSADYRDLAYPGDIEIYDTVGWDVLNTALRLRPPETV